jgi:hypothetical protein
MAHRDPEEQMSNEPSMPWVKVHTRLLDDPRFGRLPDATKARYFMLTMLAGRLDAGGVFYKNGEPLSLEEIAWALHSDVATIQTDLDLLTGCGLMIVNGNGPELTRFMDEQGPSQEEKRAAWRARQNKHRGVTVTCDTPVNNAHKSQESDSESDKESESEDSQSVESTGTDRPVQTSTWMSKAEIINFVGIPAKYKDILDKDPGITPQDLIAELARNYARQGTGKGKVQKPGAITAMNLIKHETPGAEWYEQAAWTRHLPAGILAKLGLCPSEVGKDGEDISCSGYAQNEVTAKVAAFFGGR